ncbi:MAG: hypothetical protein PUP92_10845 [Rhizonema sp. PD38]|nr:hypothetical protein [Rhizonema sp. PD38]
MLILFIIANRKQRCDRAPMGINVWGKGNVVKFSIGLYRILKANLVTVRSLIL